MPGRREECDAGIPLRRTQLDPALPRSHRLIGDQREPENVDVEVECPVLIVYGDTGELDFADHGSPFLTWKRSELFTIYNRHIAGEGNADPICASRIFGHYID